MKQEINPFSFSFRFMSEKLNCAASFSAETSLHLNIYLNLKITVMIQLKINNF